MWVRGIRISKFRDMWRYSWGVKKHYEHWMEHNISKSEQIIRYVLFCKWFTWNFVKKRHEHIDCMIEINICISLHHRFLISNWAYGELFRSLQFILTELFFLIVNPLHNDNSSRRILIYRDFRSEKLIWKFVEKSYNKWIWLKYLFYCLVICHFGSCDHFRTSYSLLNSLCAWVLGDTGEFSDENKSVSKKFLNTNKSTQFRLNRVSGAIFLRRFWSFFSTKLYKSFRERKVLYKMQYIKVCSQLIIIWKRTYQEKKLGLKNKVVLKKQTYSTSIPDPMGES
jgi:hypothetical protein